MSAVYECKQYWCLSFYHIISALLLKALTTILVLDPLATVSYFGVYYSYMVNLLKVLQVLSWLVFISFKLTMIAYR